MRALGRLAAAATVVVVATCAVAVDTGVATAATCRFMQVDNDGIGLSLTPQHLDVAYGACVQFVDNAVGPSVTIKVGAHYSVTLGYSQTTSGKSNYSATTPGKQAVTADNGAATATGSITVGSSPSPSPRPSASPTSARPQPSASSSGPQVAPSPRHARHRRPPVVPSLTALPTPGVTPPVVPPPSVAGSPSPSQSPAPAAVSGPVEPPGDRSIGLPASLAALALVGVATALVRVLLAEPVQRRIRPVDGPRSVGGSA